MDQKETIASLHAKLGIGQRKARPSPAAKRKEIQAGQIVVLERVLSEIRRRIRETPAWANGYNSAATAVELELAAVRIEARPAAPDMSVRDAALNAERGFLRDALDELVGADAPPIAQKAIIDVPDCASVRDAAYEQCAKLCDEMQLHYSAYKDTALLNGDPELSNAASGEPRACEFLAAAIRALSASTGEGAKS